MDLDKAQARLYAPAAKESESSIAVSESMGMTHSFAKVAEKIETINLLIIPAMTSNGLLAGELKDFYNGIGTDIDLVKRHFSNILQSVAIISAILEVPMSSIVEDAFKDRE